MLPENTEQDFKILKPANKCVKLQLLGYHHTVLSFNTPKKWLKMKKTTSKISHQSIKSVFVRSHTTLFSLYLYPFAILARLTLRINKNVSEED